MVEILLLYYSRHGSVAEMASHIADGVESLSNCHARIRTVADVSNKAEQTKPPVPDSGAPYADIDDLKACDGLILGSPAYFGNMAAALKYFLDQSTPIWLSGQLIGKPAGVFTSSSSLHGGQESVLLNMMTPLLHHGMVVAGIPYSEAVIHSTKSGGSPYGASHVSGQHQQPLSDEEITACRALGKRIAELAQKLK